MKERGLLIYKDGNKKISPDRKLRGHSPDKRRRGNNTEIKPMNSILLIVIILSITGCLSMNPQDPGTLTSTTLTKKQVKYVWSQVDKYMTKKEVAHILGNPTDIHNSEDVETWKYEYDITRTYGIVGFHRSDNLVGFFSKPLF